MRWQRWPVLLLSFRAGYFKAAGDCSITPEIIPAAGFRGCTNLCHADRQETVAKYIADSMRSLPPPKGVYRKPADDGEYQEPAGVL